MLLVDRRIANDARQEWQGGSTFVRYGGDGQEDLQPIGLRDRREPQNAEELRRFVWQVQARVNVFDHWLAHHISTSTGRHDLGMGLHDMGWNIELFKIHEAEAAQPIDKLRETVNNVLNIWVMVWMI